MHELVARWQTDVASWESEVGQADVMYSDDCSPKPENRKVFAILLHLIHVCARDERDRLTEIAVTG